MVLALNCGFYNTKVKSSTVKSIHETRVQLNECGGKILALDGECYEIGVGGRDISDKQLSTVHKACTEYNILKHSGTETNLVVALPMNRYLDKKYRDQYGARLVGVHEGYVDGDYKRVIVKDCTVFAEGAAAYLPYKNILKDRVVGILDFGGNTVICMIYSYGHLLKDTITTLDLGMIKLERKIIDAINVAKGWNVQEYEVREIIQNEECGGIVDQCINSHLKEIQQRLLEKKWNIDRLTIFATGGGSMQLKRYIENTFKRVIVSQRGVWDNAEGLYMVGRELYG